MKSNLRGFNNQGVTLGELQHISRGYETVDELCRGVLEYEIELAYIEKSERDLALLATDKALFLNSNSDYHDIAAEDVRLGPIGLGPVSEKHTVAYLDKPATDDEMEKFYSASS